MKNLNGRHRPGVRASIIFLALCWVSWPAGDTRAQDTHYWDNQYGTRAELLGGLVVGSSADLSATFYNPGWIAMRNEASLLLTTKAAEVYSISAQDQGPLGTSPVRRTFAVSPGYIAGRFSLGQDKGWKWAYSYLEKVKFEYHASAVSTQQNPDPAPDQNLWQSGEAFRDSRVSEYWYGLSVARKLRENLAVGFSPYGIYRSQKSRAQVSSRRLDAGSVYSDGYFADDFNYWHIRLLMKMGIAWQSENWSAGLTVTTPGLGVMGEGSVYQNLAFSGDYNPGSPGVDPPYLQVNHQENLSSRWKSPVSIAGGAGFSVNRTKLHFTAEWFNSISTFEVLESVAYEIVSRPGQYDQYRLENGARSVINYGIALDHQVNRSFSLFTSYRADFSTNPRESRNTSNLTTWDLEHLTGGASFQFLSLEFTAGIQYSWGHETAEVFDSLEFDEEGEGIQDFSDRGLKYSRWKALVGFNLPFATPGNEGPGAAINQ